MKYDNDIDLNRVVGENIKGYRNAMSPRGQTMKEVADALNIPFDTYASYEKHKRLPRLDTLIKIALYLGVTPNDLLGVQRAEDRISPVLKEALSPDETLKTVYDDVTDRPVRFLIRSSQHLPIVIHAGEIEALMDKSRQYAGSLMKQMVAQRRAQSDETEKFQMLKQMAVSIRYPTEFTEKVVQACLQEVHELQRPQDILFFFYLTSLDPAGSTEKAKGFFEELKGFDTEYPRKGAEEYQEYLSYRPARRNSFVERMIAERYDWDYDAIQHGARSGKVSSFEILKALCFLSYTYLEDDCAVPYTGFMVEGVQFFLGDFANEELSEKLKEDEEIEQEITVPQDQDSAEDEYYEYLEKEREKFHPVIKGIHGSES